MKFCWWFLVFCVIVSSCVFITGLATENLITLGVGAVLIGLSVITMWGFDGYMNTGRWFGE